MYVWMGMDYGHDISSSIGAEYCCIYHPSIHLVHKHLVDENLKSFKTSVVDTKLFGNSNMALLEKWMHLFSFSWVVSKHLRRGVGFVVYFCGYAVVYLRKLTLLKTWGIVI